MIFATYSITDDRKQKISFGGPYFIAGQDLLVKADNTDITGPDSLNGKKLCSVTGSTSAKKIKDNYASGVQLQEFDTYSKCVEALNAGLDRRRHHRQRHPGRFRGAGSVPGQAQGRRQAVLRGAVRRRHQEGRHRALRQDQHRAGEDGVGRRVGEGAERHGRRLRLQARRGHQPAQAGRLQLVVRLPAAPDRAGDDRDGPPRPVLDRRALIARRDEGGSRWTPCSTLLDEYDVVAAFWMTIKLTFFGAIGAFIIGTVVAIMRVSPVEGLPELRHRVRDPDPQHPADAAGVLLRLRARHHPPDQPRTGELAHLHRRQQLPLGRWSRSPSTTRPSWPRRSAAASTRCLRGRPRRPVPSGSRSCRPSPRSCCRRRSEGRSRRWATP